jgi:hypothetical protein
MAAERRVGEEPAAALKQLGRARTEGDLHGRRARHQLKRTGQSTSRWRPTAPGPIADGPGQLGAQFGAASGPTPEWRQRRIAEKPDLRI